jgi:hypothetical protein
VAALLPVGLTPAAALARALLADGVPLARVPAALARALLAHGACSGDRTASPAFVRAHYRGGASGGGGGASGGGGAAAFPSLAPPARSLAPGAGARVAVGDAVGGGGACAPSVAAPAAHALACLLLEHCLSGLAPKEYRELGGLPLLPLADGSLGVLRAKVWGALSPIRPGGCRFLRFSVFATCDGRQVIRWRRAVTFHFLLFIWVRCRNALSANTLRAHHLRKKKKKTRFGRRRWTRRFCRSSRRWGSARRRRGGRSCMPGAASTPPPTSSSSTPTA